MNEFSTGDRVRDRISEDTGVVKDHFMNQAIVCWDQPDEDGNLVSSVPASDLEPINVEAAPVIPSKITPGAANENHLGKGDSQMKPSNSIVPEFDPGPVPEYYDVETFDSLEVQLDRLVEAAKCPELRRIISAMIHPEEAGD